MGEATAIVLSGGTGGRLQGSFVPTQFAEVEGKPILAHCLDTYEALPMIDQIALVIDERYEQLYHDVCSTYGYPKVRRFVPGGATRQESVSRGLRAIDPCEIVVVQDGVRPFSSEKAIAEVIEAARLHGAADVVVPMFDTIVEQHDGFIVNAPDRTNPRSGQAPQAFRYEVLVRAHEHARAMGIRDATDDAQLVLDRGGAVRAVEGSFEGLELTTMIQLLLAQQLLEAPRQDRPGVKDRTLAPAADPAVAGLLERAPTPDGSTVRRARELDDALVEVWTTTDGGRTVTIP
jgi:2-C-methyl-D-erythritol 4-phosphate cytidylyltransferase